MANLTFAERCALSENCLPESEYREQLIKLHRHMLAKIDKLESYRQEVRNAYCDVREAEYEEFVEIPNEEWDTLVVAING